MIVMFFDIGGTLADIHRAPDSAILLTPLGQVLDLLDALAGYRLGVMADPGPDSAEACNVALMTAFGARFDSKLVHWQSITDPNVLNRTLAADKLLAKDCLFVSDNALARRAAIAVGMRTTPHPLFALATAEERPVFWVRINLSFDLALSDLASPSTLLELAPLHVATEHLLLAMATTKAVAMLKQLGCTVETYGEVGTTSAYLLRDDRPAPADHISTGLAPLRPSQPDEQRAAAAFAYVTGELNGFTAAVMSLGAAPRGVYLAAEAGTLVEELHIPGAHHGHTERLLIDSSLLNAGSYRGVTVSAGFSSNYSARLLATLEREITADFMRTQIGRLSGAAPLSTLSDDVIVSRHIAHAGNAKAVKYVETELSRLGFQVRLQEFDYRGTRLQNIEAYFDASGADEVVLISAHLDSTASFGHFIGVDGLPRDYNPAHDPAPGADDDASGVAAVLGAARALRALLDEAELPTRSMRFVLFNGEEQGLLGSKYYARAAAQRGDRIIGVLQMDMIGGLQGAARKVEIHAGCAVPGPAAQASNTLADSVEQAVNTVAPGAFIVQRLTGPDDPAAGRSDHASFHERGWAAVAVSENFFADTEPASGTQQYHLPGDVLTDPHMNPDYAAAIARGVASAGLALAGL